MKYLFNNIEFTIKDYMVKLMVLPIYILARVMWFVLIKIEPADKK